MSLGTMTTVSGVGEGEGRSIQHLGVGANARQIIITPAYVFLFRLLRLSVMLPV